jgi:hypothetical protein
LFSLALFPLLRLPRFWGVGEKKNATIQSGGFDEQTATGIAPNMGGGEEKCGMLRSGGFDGQNATDLHERI